MTPPEEPGQGITAEAPEAPPAVSLCPLETIRNRPDLAKQVAHITTPGGWIARRLTGHWNLGIGDASGMFPIRQTTLDYDAERLADFDALVARTAPGLALPPLRDLLPAVRKAGEDAGFDSVWVMDHFYQLPGLGKPEEPMFEAYSLLTALAAVTSKVRLGAMVGGVTYRNPAFLAKSVVVGFS